MGRQKFQDRNIRKLIRLGPGSLAITLPIEHLFELKWKEKQKVLVKRKGKKLVVEDWRPKKRAKKKKRA